MLQVVGFVRKKASLVPIRGKGPHARWQHAIRMTACSKSANRVVQPALAVVHTQTRQTNVIDQQRSRAEEKASLHHVKLVQEVERAMGRHQCGTQGRLSTPAWPTKNQSVSETVLGEPSPHLCRNRKISNFVFRLSVQQCRWHFVTMPSPQTSCQQLFGILGLAKKIPQQVVTSFFLVLCNLTQLLLCLDAALYHDVRELREAERFPLALESTFLWSEIGFHVALEVGIALPL